MVPYIIIYIIVFLLSFKIKKEKITIFDILLLFVLISFSSLRVGIGTDYKLYKVIFEKATTISELGTSRTGIGFSYLLIFIKNILGLEYQYLIAFCSVITIVCFYYYIKKSSKNPGRSILIYLAIGIYVSAFNGFRQNMSIALALVGLTLLKNNKKIMSIIFIILSILFHSSTLILILAYYFIVIRNIRIKPIYAFIGFVILFFSYNIVFSNLINLFDNYSGYAETSFDTTPGIGTFVIVTTYFVIYFFMFLSKYEMFPEDEKRYISIFAIAICTMSLQLHNWLFSRVTDIFMAFMPILLSTYYDLICKENKKKFSLFFHMGCFIYYLMYVYSFGEVIPYHNIFL